MDSQEWRTPNEGLSTRAVEILLLLAEGLSDREIAERLIMTINTVKWYNRQIYSTLGVGSRTQAIARARELHLLREGEATPSITVTFKGLPADPERRLAVMPLRTLPDPAPLPPGSRMPLGRNSLFVGRAQDLLALAALFRNGQTTAVHQVETVAVTGLGGVGKTQLASEFVHRYGQYFAGGAFWLSFESPEAISAEMVACGGAGALDLRPDFAQHELDEQVRLVQAAWREPTPRLLIFDNCENPELLVRWRPTSGGCRILVTSRRNQWETVLGVQVHPLVVLSREESLTLLQAHRVEAPSDALGAIAEELGDLPLALHLAGRFLYRYRRVISATQYLAALRAPALLHHPSFQGGGISPTAHLQHIGRTFALSYERLDRQDKTDITARRLLAHLACFAPGEPVRQDLVTETLGLKPDEPQDMIRGEDAVARLLDLGLIAAEADDTLRMHRLVAVFVQDVALDLLQLAQKAIEQLVAKVLDRANEAGAPLSLLDWQVHLRHVVGAALARRDEQAAMLSFLLSKHLWLLSDYDGARGYALQALAIRRALLGEKHPDTAASYHRLGIVEQMLGDLEGAHGHLARALAIRRQVLGEDHADTADSLIDLGDLLWTERRVDEAIAHLEHALAICGRVLPEDNLVTAEAANNLATCLLEGLGDAARARPYMERALRIRRQKLGEDHPYTAKAYNNMGFVLQALGELDEARAHYERALDIRRRTLGDRHPETAHTLLTIGMLLRQQGDKSQAKTQVEKALDICGATVGDEHLLTAACLNELGAILLAQGEFAAARDCLERALAVRRMAYKVEHANLAITLQNLGVVLLEQGDLAGAERHLSDALGIRRRTLGDENLLTAESLYYLGKLAHVHGTLRLARDFYNQALDIYIQHKSMGHATAQKVQKELALLASDPTP